jgi:hypothetical protein
MSYLLFVSVEILIIKGTIGEAETMINLKPNIAIEEKNYLAVINE